jgi:hypothetical protein
MGGTGAPSAPVLRVKEPKKTVARSARLRTCGQNPLGLEELSNSILYSKEDKFLLFMVPLSLTSPTSPADIGSYSACHTVIRKIKKEGREPASFDYLRERGVLKPIKQF